MPIYELYCKSCEKHSDMLLPVSKRSGKGVPCGSCGVKSLIREYISPPVTGCDATKGPGKDFKRLMDGMKRGVPRRYRNNLDHASSLRCRKYGRS